MKAQWIYFMAGAGLMAIVMTFNMPKDSALDCKAIAGEVKDFYSLSYVDSGSELEKLSLQSIRDRDLHPDESLIVDYIRFEGADLYGEAYALCRAIEEGNHRSN